MAWGWQPQAITWTNIDLSSEMFTGIHLRTISQEMLMNLTRNMCSEITLSNYYHIDGFVQDCSNSIANALELLQSCTKPSIYRPRG